MTAPRLKDFFNADLVREIASDFSHADPGFDSAGFVRTGLNGLDRLELTQRGWHLAEALRKFLSQDFSKAADVVVASLGPELSHTGSFGMAPFRYMPHVFFVQKYGLDDFEAAMRAQYELTKRFSAESSIRAYLVKYPEKTYARLRKWASDESVHVRRLVSEGSRPRLPWAARLHAFQEDPSPVIALLELLKDDPERYVQRSVANNLNDIGKDHPHLAVEVCRRWQISASPVREWIVKHALRSLVKKGHRGALKALGVAGKPRVSVSGAKLVPPNIKLGGKLRFSFEIASTSKRTQEILVDYAVHFVKANGATRPKVFKLRRIVLPPTARMALGSTVSFEDLTTRKHYPGRHRIDVLINGITPRGGSYLSSALNVGTVFRLNKDGSDYRILHSFGDVGDGENPRGELIEGNDGTLYGTTADGGALGGGTMFKLNKDGSGYSILHEFAYSDWPGGGLLEGNDGALYGTAERGGTNSAGVVFKINKDGTGYTVLHHFAGSYSFSGDDGAYPHSTLLLVSDGALYGTTTLGGTTNSGTVFKLNLDGTGYSMLHSFNIYDH